MAERDLHDQPVPERRSTLCGASSIIGTDCPRLAQQLCRFSRLNRLSSMRRGMAFRF
jgi:hypothetical protein